jgi:hypothetical protein
MITTTTQYQINTTEEQLKKNLYSAYLDILTDGFKDDVEYFEHDAHRLSAVIEDIGKNGFRSVFRDGYTMMLLTSDDFNFVEKWFRDEQPNQSLQIVIKMSNGETEIVDDEDLSY